MKRIKKIISMLLMIVVLVTSSMAVLANSTEETQKPEVMAVYNGIGEFVCNINTLDELNQFGIDTNVEPRGGTILATVLVVAGTISTIAFVAEILTGVNAAQWIYSNVTLPIYSTLKEMKIYSVDGKINNPYPPNSYEGAMWQKNNFYVVVK